MTRDASTPISDGHSLEYRGFRFELRAEPIRGGYQPSLFLFELPRLRRRRNCPTTPR